MFEAVVRNGEQGITSLTVYYEQGDIVSARKSIQDKLGPPSDTGVSEGFRFWTWAGEGLITRIATYSAGVSLSLEQVQVRQ
jgi:hypothetical protein